MVEARPEHASRVLATELVHEGMDAREFTTEGRRYVRVAPPGVPAAGIDVLCAPGGYISHLGNGLGTLNTVDKVVWHLLFLFGRQPRARH